MSYPLVFPTRVLSKCTTHHARKVRVKASLPLPPGVVSTHQNRKNRSNSPGSNSQRMSGFLNVRVPEVGDFAGLEMKKRKGRLAQKNQYPIDNWQLWKERNFLQTSMHLWLVKLFLKQVLPFIMWLSNLTSRNQGWVSPTKWTPRMTLVTPIQAPAIFPLTTSSA